MTATKTNERPGTRAVLRHSGLSASKVRQVLDLIRGQDVDRAAEILVGTEREAANIIGKVLASAVANAAHNDFQNPDELYVSACYADEGTTAKRWRPRARGRATRIRKRSSHITIIVSRLPPEKLELRRKRMEAVSAQPFAPGRRLTAPGRPFGSTLTPPGGAGGGRSRSGSGRGRGRGNRSRRDRCRLEVDAIEAGEPEDDGAENEVDDVSDESAAEVVDMDDEDETVEADADADEKGE